jgi:hypothetical protein
MPPEGSPRKAVWRVSRRAAFRHCVKKADTLSQNAEDIGRGEPGENEPSEIENWSGTVGLGLFRSSVFGINARFG